ncbi:MAG TPA: hypothetical protein VMH88_11100 [Gemmatimonadales bacterium]|nr:hypothetical protein [Gemmatimonadales bacterium]
MLDMVRPAFRAIGATIVPEASAMDERAWSDLEQVVEDALATRPLRMRRQLVLLIRVVQILPVIRYGRPFTGLDPERRTRLLDALQNAPVLLLRRGIWGLRTLVLMGYYGRPAAWPEIGYRGAARGWEARR